MALTDAQLFDFNARLMADYDDAKGHATLAEDGDAFRYQLVAALHLDGWAERLEGRASLMGEKGESHDEGYVRALREVAAHLRQGDYLPGGVLYNETAGS